MVASDSCVHAHRTDCDASEFADDVYRRLAKNVYHDELTSAIDAELQEVQEVFDWLFGPGSGAWTYAMHEPKCAWQTEPNTDSCNCRVQRARALLARLAVEKEKESMADELTIEQALKELREMFPDRWLQVEVSERPGARVFMVRVYGKPGQGRWLPSLTDCMAQVREWKDKESK